MANRHYLTRGDDEPFTLTVRDENGLLVDLTSVTITLSAKKSHSATSYVFQLTAGNGLTLTNPAQGEVAVEIPAAATQAFTKETVLVFDVELIEGGKVRTCTRGEFVVQMDVTRP